MSVEKVKKDKTLVLFTLIAIVTVIYFGLNSAMYYLGYSVLTLGIVTLIGLSFSKKFMYEKNVSAGILIIIPIAIRMAFFSVTTTVSFMDLVKLAYEDAIASFTIFGLLTLIALAEESFRAGVISLLETFKGYFPFDETTNRIIIVTIANFCWVILHFIQRQFSLTGITLYYFIWLLITGYILSYILYEAGLGTAVLSHLILNLTA